MAVKAYLDQHEGFVNLQIFADEIRLRVTDDPCLEGYELAPWIEFYFDDAKLEEGTQELLGVELHTIEKMTEEDLRAIERLNPPRIDVPEADLFDVSVTEVLRRVQQAWAEKRELIAA